MRFDSNMLQWFVCALWPDNKLNQWLLHFCPVWFCWHITNIHKTWCTDKPVDFNASPWKEDIHVIAGALKLYFRELPEPLVTFNGYDGFMEAMSKSSSQFMSKASVRPLAWLDFWLSLNIHFNLGHNFIDYYIVGLFNFLLELIFHLCFYSYVYCVNLIF